MNLDLLNKKLTSSVFSSGKDSYEKCEPLPTGLANLDWAIGIGGLPKGHITEIFGKQSDGKTSLALTIIANAQKQGLTCIFIDAEQTFNFEYAKSLGVDTDSLIIGRALHGEEYLEAIEFAVKEKSADLIVVDSVDALTPRSEMEAAAFQATMGAKGKMMGRFCRRIIEPLKKNKIVLVMLNQTRVDFVSGFEDTPGGKALKFYTSLRIKLKQSGVGLKQGETMVGKKIEMKIVKNKVGNPFGVVEANFLFGSGFSAEADIVDVGLKSGVLTKKGNTIMYQELKLGVGQTKAREFLQSNPDLLEEIKGKL